MSERVKYIHANGLISQDPPSDAEIIKTSDGRSLVKTDRDVIVTVREAAGRDRQIVVRKGASSQYAAHIYEKIFPDKSKSSYAPHFVGAPDFFEGDTIIAALLGERKATQWAISVTVPGSSDPVLCLDSRYISNPTLNRGTLVPGQPLDTLDFTQDDDLYLQGNVNFDQMVQDALNNRETHILASFFVLLADGYGIAQRMRADGYGLTQSMKKTTKKKTGKKKPAKKKASTTSTSNT